MNLALATLCIKRHKFREVASSHATQGHRNDPQFKKAAPGKERLTNHNKKLVT